MGELFLGLDVGTQGTKALLVDAEAGVVARASASYGMIEGLAPGSCEQHPDTWLDAIERTCRALFADHDARRVAGVGVSGQQHGCVLLDASRRVLRPAKLWCDTSTAAEARALSERLGRRVPAGFTASKVAWSARHEPRIWRATAHVLLPHDYVNLALTGELVAERGDASGTGWLDVERGEHDPRALEAIGAIAPGLAERVAPLRASDSIAGRVTDAAAARFGILARTPVATGSGDNMLAALGSGACEPGVCVLSLGTSATLFAQSRKPVVDPEGLVAAFCDATGAWLPLVCAMNATGVLAELASAFGLDHARLSALARTVPAGANGAVLAPFLAGERVPDLPNARGVLAGIGHGSFAPGALYRAALEGVAANLAGGLDRLRALGTPIESVRAAGGGAQNDLWLEILAAALGVPIARLVEVEAAALGAAMQAEWVVRRARGEAVGIDTIARERVRVEERAFAPEPSLVAAQREVRGRFDALVARHYG